MLDDVAGVAPPRHQGPDARQRATAALEESIQGLGLDVTVMIGLMAEALAELVPDESRRAAQRMLALEWIGAVGDECTWEATLSDRHLRSVLARRVAMEQVRLLPAHDVAARTGNSVDTIVELVQERALYGFHLRGAFFLPSWQFVDPRAESLVVLSEFLPTVLMSIPIDALPSMVSRVMTSEDPNLSRGAMRYSPRDYLIAGGGPWPVVRTLLLVLEGSAQGLGDLLLGGRA